VLVGIYDSDTFTHKCYKCIMLLAIRISFVDRRHCTLTWAQLRNKTERLGSVKSLQLVWALYPDARLQWRQPIYSAVAQRWSANFWGSLFTLSKLPLSTPAHIPISTISCRSHLEFLSLDLGIYMLRNLYEQKVELSYLVLCS